MHVGQALRGAFEIARLEPRAIRAASADRDATGAAVTLLAIAGAAVGFARAGLTGALVGAVAVPLLSAFECGLVHALASTLSELRRGDFVQLFRPWGMGMGLLRWVALIPVVGSLIAGLWQLPVAFRVVRDVYALPPGKALLAVLAPALLFPVLAGMALPILLPA